MNRQMHPIRFDECKNKPHYFEMFLKERNNSHPKTSKSSEKQSPPLLGDILESALSKVGITKERVSKWIGQDCGCSERKEKLNRLHAWAKRVLSGKTEDAEKHLNEITEDQT
jgi:hypothetical protein